MARKTFKYGALDVSVSDVGTGTAPWDKDQHQRPEYSITVRKGDTVYKTKGWGSIRDYQEGLLDHRGMAWSVIGDLASAYYDPDEFFTMVIGEAQGREAYERGKVAEHLVTQAAKFGHALEKAADEAREEEEAE